jgi:hypothetical protein
MSLKVCASSPARGLRGWLDERLDAELVLALPQTALLLAGAHLFKRRKWIVLRAAGHRSAPPLNDPLTRIARNSNRPDRKGRYGLRVANLADPERQRRE